MDIPAVVALAFVASITPGPNNVMLLASGMNHGVRRSLRHLFGVNLGFSLLLFLVALGLGTVFERYGVVEVVLELLGGTYLLWLAYRIATTRSIGAAGRESQPLTFLEAAMFQWVNPKAWIMTTTASSTLLVAGDSIVVGAASLTALFWIVNLPCVTAWMVSGATASRWIADERRLVVVNRVLGGLLVGTVLLLVT